MTSFSASIPVNSDSAQILNPSNLTTLEDIWIVGELINNPLRVWLEIGGNLFSRFIDLTPGSVSLSFRDIFPRDRNYPPIVLNQLLALKCNRVLSEDESLFAVGFTENSSDSSNSNTSHQYGCFGTITGDFLVESDGIIKFNTVSKTDYDPNSGLFTVPITGVYHLHCTILFQGVLDSTVREIALKKNDEIVGIGGRLSYNANSTGQGGYLSMSAAATTALAEGDEIAIITGHNGYIHGSSNWSRFGIFLVE